MKPSKPKPPARTPPEPPLKQPLSFVVPQPPGEQPYGRPLHVESGSEEEFGEEVRVKGKVAQYVKKLKKELRLQREELGRRRLALQQQKEMLENTIPIAEARRLAFKALRKGQALSFLASFFDSSQHVRTSQQIGFHQLAKNAMGSSQFAYKQLFGERPSSEKVYSDAQLRLLREEQLVLLAENTRLMKKVKELEQVFKGGGALGDMLDADLNRGRDAPAEALGPGALPARRVRLGQPGDQQMTAAVLLMRTLETRMKINLARSLSLLQTPAAVTLPAEHGRRISGRVKTPDADRRQVVRPETEGLRLMTRSIARMSRLHLAMNAMKGFTIMYVCSRVSPKRMAEKIAVSAPRQPADAAAGPFAPQRALGGRLDYHGLVSQAYAIQPPYFASLPSMQSRQMTSFHPVRLPPPTSVPLKPPRTFATTVETAPKFTEQAFYRSVNSDLHRLHSPRRRHDERLQDSTTRLQFNKILRQALDSQ